MATISDVSRFAQLSQAAYADFITFSDQAVKDALTGQETAGFAQAQAEDFTTNYRVLAYQPNDTHGFSATIFQSKTNPTEIVLAIRGTEFPSVDVTGADADIATFGAARDQIISLYTWFQDLLSSGDPSLSPLLTNKVTVTGHSLGGHLALAFSRLFPDKVNGVYTYNAPGFKQTADVDSFFNQVAGHPTTFPVTTVPITNVNAANGPELISGRHILPGPQQMNIFVEDQGVIRLDAGNHSSLLLSDSLALYDLFGRVDQTQDVAIVTAILETVSATRDRSFEAALDALRKIFQGPGIVSTPISSPLDENGASVARNTYYGNLIQLRDTPALNGNYHIDSLVGMPDSAVFSQAKAATPDGQAYRYALKELNPFVVRGMNYQTLHNQDGALDLYDANTGQGTWTLVALSDRAELLTEKLKFTLADGTPSNRSETLYVDQTTVFDNLRGATATQVVIFGDDGGRELVGRVGNDHLYGGAGADVLTGGAGLDYLEGRLDNDTLDGGIGNDILLGQQGNDTLDSGADNDQLDGGLGDDTLIGGQGADTYYYRTGQGTDTIVDSDRVGVIRFDSQILQGGIRHTSDPADTWRSEDGQVTFAKSGNDLVINGTLRISNFDFTNGALGIQLITTPNTQAAAAPVINFTNGLPDVLVTGTDAPETIERVGAVNYTVFGNGGSDVLSTDSGNDQLYGGIGNDQLVAHAGNDRLNGEGGTDLLIAGDGDDLLDGGLDNDELQGEAGNDLLYGGAGDDVMLGDSQTTDVGQDYMDGGDGNDSMSGGAGDDVLFGGAGDDSMSGEGTSAQGAPLSAITGNDYLDGGEGNDGLTGFAGDDILLGGAGNDLLNGDNFKNSPYAWDPTVDGEDYLDGGDGDDELDGGGRDDVLIGGVGNDLLYGEGIGYQALPGNDWLDGGEGNDQLRGGLGADTLIGGTGDDFLLGDFTDEPGADDVLDGGAGVDELHGGGGDDLLLGGTEDDLLFGEDGLDFLDGGAGADELQGGAGDDVLIGGTDSDRLFGDAGDDALEGDEGDDLLVGDTGDDALFGGDGVDELQGGVGADLLSGGAGNDLLFGQDDADTLFGDEGEDELQGGVGSDVLAGDIGNDRLFGQEDDDTLFGDDGNDQLQGGAGADQLFGGAGDDLVYGDDPNNPGATGNDVLEGGTGGDSLQGGGGADTYMFNAGDGVDTIVDASGEGNRLVFGAGVTSDSLSLGLGVVGTLVVRVGTAGDAVQIFNFDPVNLSGPHPIDTFEFADGTVLTYSQLASRGFELFGTAANDTITGTALNDRIAGGSGNDALSGLSGPDTLLGEDGADQLFGGSGDDGLDGGAGSDTLFGGDGADQLFGASDNDALFGEQGNDTLDGGSGNDMLDGGEGNDVLAAGLGDDQLFGGVSSDTYRFNVGDGSDTIVDDASSGDVNRVMFGPGINALGLRYRLESGQLILPVDGNGDKLSFGFPNASDIYNQRAVDRFEFTDGTTLTHAQLVDRGIEVPGTEFDDFLFGTNAKDVFTGGLGNDQLFGGTGNDQYVFKLGDGVDTISDTASAGEGNELVFGTGISSGELTLGWQAPQFGFGSNQLLIRVGATGDAITLDQFNRNNVLGPHAVDSYVFADGTILSYSQLIDRGFDLTGTAGNDVVAGTNVVDRLSGLEGNDMLQAGAGNDVLDGGAGNDQLQGGTGDDTYLFGRGSGQDRLIDIGGTYDAIQLSANVNPTDVQVTKHGRDLVLSITGTTDQLTLSQFFLNPILQVDEVRFADGTVWDAATLASRAQQDIVGTDNADTLTGTDGDDVLRGLAGDDQLSGQAGDDLLDGGAGADTLTGGPGSDIYVVDNAGDAVIEAAGEGTDTVQSSIAYALGTNVENLTLTGTLAINGTGNALNNMLTGNSAENVLTGGAGNDTYHITLGDTVIENVNEGIDTVQSDVTYTLGANVENLTLSGNAPINGTGNDLNNVLVGNSSVNLLAGGKGDDTYVVGAGDTVVELAGEGIDTVETNRSYELGSNVENLTLLDTGASFPGFSQDTTSVYGSAVTLRGVGNELDNVLIGNSGFNVLEGGAGNDTLSGGARGAFVFDGAGDVLRGGPGEDTYLFGRGSGSVTIDDVVAGEVDSIQMASDIRPDDVLVGRASFPSSQLYLSIAQTGDLLGISYSSLDDILTKQVRFADGTLWDGATLLAKSVPPTPPSSDPGVVLNGDSGNNVLMGGSGDDQLSGFAGDDQLDGQGGNDTLDGGPGSDVLLGGTGNDSLSGGSGLDLSGNDILVGGDGSDSLIGSGGNNDLDGGDGNDYLVSWDGNDTLKGGSGNDTLQAGGGDDLLDGGAGDDLLKGDAGADIYMFGRGYGRDFASALPEDTVRFAQDVLPSDVVVATDGSFLMLRINGTGDELMMPFPSEQFQSGIGRVEFSDGTVWDRDYLRETAGFIGTDGPDFISGPGSGVMLFGGKGDDHYVVQDPDVVVENPGEGTDLISTLQDYTLPSNVENLELRDQLPGIIGNDVTLRPTLGMGNDDNNVIIGNSADNILDGGAGNDTLIGGFAVEENPDLGDGNDVLIGGAGDDVLKPFGYVVGGIGLFDETFFGTDLLLGGPGDDTYVLQFENFAEPVSLPNALVVELPNEGNDTVVVAHDYTLGPNVENMLIFGGARGTGNELDNVLIGGSEANVLEGGMGNDTLIGGFGQIFVSGPGYGFTPEFDDQIDDQAEDILIGGVGNDTYLIGVGDTVVENADEGIDTVLSSNNYALGDNVENLTLRGTASINGMGNALDNSLIGNSGANVLTGGIENDSLLGGAGNDTYVFSLGDGVDTISDEAVLGAGNKIQFGTGIVSNDLTVTQTGNSLTIQVGVGGDAIQLLNFDATGTNGSLVVETLEFSDGNQVSLTSLLGPTGPTITEGDDVITLGATDEVVNALGGNDVVDAGAGNDTITGGTGNDTLTGGVGDDTYVFNLGDGMDTINDTALTGEGNTLQFGPGITPADLNLGVGSLLLRVGSSGDAIHLTTFDPNDAYGPHTIETFRFTDGTVLTYSQLIDRGFDLTGTAGDDTITGTNVVDRITGLAGNDVIQSGAGDDVLDGGSGADSMRGGTGNDTYLVDNISDVVTENANEGIDTVQSSISYMLGANVENLTLTGAANLNGTGNGLINVLTGNLAANVLDGGTGADTLLGGAGNDTYVVDNAGDVVNENVNEGIDTVQSSVTYTLAANIENLTLTGSAAINGTGNALDNVLTGNSAVNVLTGGVGNDTYVIGAGDTVVEQANEGTDTVMTDQSYTLGANVENLTLTGTANLNGTGNTLNNILTGNSGNNILDGQAGADTMVGGVGDDTYLVDNTGDVVTEQANEGTDSLLTAVSYQLSANVENLTLTGAGAVNGTGNAGNNVLAGNGAANSLDGGAGDDTLLGGAGNDTMLGGTGNDRLDGGTGIDGMTGGTGNDTYVVDAASDSVTEAANEGTDTVESSLTYTLGANVENLTLTGAAAINGTGNSLDNILLGNSGNNTLSGGAGNDTLNGVAGADAMSGGTGDDTYVVDNVGDTVSESSNQGTDTVRSSITYTLGSNVENLTLTGTANINGTGSSANNILVGNSGANNLDGGSGNDTMDGGDGNDSLLGGSGNDTVAGGNGNDSLDGGGNDDTLFGAAGNDTMLGGSGNDNLDGGDGDDSLDAGSGDDVLAGGVGTDQLLGGGGNDQLTGGPGNDTLQGGTGNDTYSFVRGDGQDTISENDATPGNSDKLLYGAGINPLDLIISQQANDLRLTIYGSTDQMTIQNWYTSTNSQIETIQAGNGQQLLNTKVNQLIQAMATFGAQTGLTWEQAIAQRPQDVQNILAASWQ